MVWSSEKRHIWYTVMFKPLLALCLQRPHLPQPEDSQYWIQRMEKQIPPFWWGLRYKTLWVCFFFFFLRATAKVNNKSYLSGLLWGSYKIRLLAWSWHTVGLPWMWVSFPLPSPSWWRTHLYERHDGSVDSNSILFQNTWKLKPCGI